MPTKQPDWARTDKEPTETFGFVLSLLQSLNHTHRQSGGLSVLFFGTGNCCPPAAGPTSRQHHTMLPLVCDHRIYHVHANRGDKLNLTHVMETAQWSRVQALRILVSAGPTLRIRAPDIHWKLRMASSRDKKPTDSRKKGPSSCLKITAYNKNINLLQLEKKKKTQAVS